MLAVVILSHLAVAAVPVAWVKFHPGPPAPSAVNVAAREPVIEWIEPELVPKIPSAATAESEPDPPEPMIAAAPAPRPIPKANSRPKITAAASAKRPAPAAPIPRNRPAEIKTTNFQSGRQGDDPPTSAAPAPTPDRDAVADYHARIQRLMEEQWKQPQHLEGASLPAARVAVSISRSGEILDVELAASSGKAELDASALAAARSVRRIDPLPSEIENDTYRLLIRFVLH